MDSRFALFLQFLSDAGWGKVPSLRSGARHGWYPRRTPNQNEPQGGPKWLLFRLSQFPVWNDSHLHPRAFAVSDPDPEKSVAASWLTFADRILASEARDEAQITIEIGICAGPKGMETRPIMSTSGASALIDAGHKQILSGIGGLKRRRHECQGHHSTCCLTLGEPAGLKRLPDKTGWSEAMAALYTRMDQEISDDQAREILRALAHVHEALTSMHVSSLPWDQS